MLLFVLAPLKGIHAAAFAVKNGQDPKGKVYKYLVESQQADQNQLEEGKGYNTPYMILHTMNEKDKEKELIQWAEDHGASWARSMIFSVLSDLSKKIEETKKPPKKFLI